VTRHACFNRNVTLGKTQLKELQIVGEGSSVGSNERNMCLFVLNCD